MERLNYKAATHRFFYRHSAAYSDVVDFNLGERFVRLATRTACILQVADEPLVEAVLVDLACAVGVAFVALKRDEWHNFSFSLRRLWRLCRSGAGKCVGSSSGAGCGGIHAAVNDGSFALIFFRGCYRRVNSGVMEADAACVNILEFFFKRRSFSLVVVFRRFFNVFFQGGFASCSVVAHDGSVGCKL